MSAAAAAAPAPKTAEELRKLERSLAYSYASELIGNVLAEVEGSDLVDVFDLDSAAYSDEDEVEDAAAYLESRGLLLRSTLNPRWVAILDESEEEQ